MKKQIVYLLMSCLLLFMAGCEYEVGENFVDIKEPTADNIQMQIELNVDNVGEQLLVYQPTSIAYNIKVPGYSVLGCNFKIGEKEWKGKPAIGDFQITKDEIPNGNYTLTCEVYAKTGSGSIADQADIEAFVGTFSWPIRVAIDVIPAKSFRGWINNDGYMQFVWEKPELSYHSFSHYRLVDNYGHEVILTDLDQESYVYKSYVGEEQIFKMEVCFKDGHTQPWNLGLAYMDPVDVHMKVEHPVLDKIRISWSNPYKSVVNIHYQGELVAEELADNFIELPYNTFGSTSQLSIRFLPADKADRTEWSGYTLLLDNQKLEMGVLVYPGGNSPRYGYNVQENVLYVSSYSEVKSWQLPDCIEQALFMSPQYENVSEYAISLFDTKMAAQHPSGIEVFNGKNMSDSKMFTAQYPVSFCGNPVLTKDDKLIAFLSSMSNVKMAVYDLSTEQQEKVIELPGTGYNVYSFYATPDVRYLYYEQNKELHVADIKDYLFRELHKLPAGYSSWCFNPLHSEQLFVASDGKIQLYDCSSGLSVIKTFDYPGMEVRNVDPKTGYLLLADRDRLLILDPQNGSELLSMPKGAYAQVELLGNSLCAGNSAVLSIEKYLKK